MAYLLLLVSVICKRNIVILTIHSYTFFKFCKYILHTFPCKRKECSTGRSITNVEITAGVCIFEHRTAVGDRGARARVSVVFLDSRVSA